MSTFNPVYRATVVYSNSATGQITVRIPSLAGADSTFDISYIGRAAINGVWAVPSIGEQIVVTADDPNFTNTFWVQTNAVSGPQGPAGPQGTMGPTQVLVYESSGTFVKSNYPWLKTVVIRMVGGGGAGGGAAVNASGQSSAGAGGGSGGYIYHVVTDLSTIGASVSVNIGAGGTGVNSGQGNSGGQTNAHGLGFVTFSCGGGGGGTAGISGTTGGSTGGSAGNTSGNGIYNYLGQPGSYGLNAGNQAISGAGAGSPFGPGGASFTRAPNTTALNGMPAYAFGAGGGGSAQAGWTLGGTTGGAGKNGVVILELYG